MSKNKYPSLRINGIRIYVHRYEMQKHIGRKLESHEHVYHLNGDGFDNRIENLVLITKKSLK